MVGLNGERRICGERVEPRLSRVLRIAAEGEFGGGGRW